MPPSPEDSVARSRVPAWAQLSLVLLPVAVAYAILARTFTSVPILDDYEQLFVFALQFAKMPTTASKFGLLFTTQVAAYKLIFEHLLVGLQIVCFGHMNFGVLVWIVDLLPALIFALIWRHSDADRSPSKGRYLLLMPVSLLLFSMNWAETLNWAACGLQYQVVICFSLAALHFLVKPLKGRSLFVAVLCGVIATSAFPNGVLVWPVGILYLWLQTRKEAGFGLRLAGWSGGFALSMGGYLYHYQRVGIVSKGTFPAKLMYAVMFSGSAIENMHHRPVPYISIAIGLAVLLAFADMVRTKFYQRNPFVFYSTLWVLLTSLVVANARIGYGLNQSLSSRYKVYCDVLLIFTYLYLLDRFRDAGAVKVRRLVGISTAAALLVCVGGDVAGGHMLRLRKQRAAEAMAAYVAAPQMASPMFLFDDNLNAGELQVEDKARVELNEAIELGIYVVPGKFLKGASEHGGMAMVRADAFGTVVHGVHPAEVLAAAYRATRPWGTILLGEGVYVSPFLCGGGVQRYTTPRRFVGVGRPWVDDERQPRRLMGGTVIEGEVCGSAPLVMAHLGVDAGPATVQGLYGGVKTNGIYLASHGGFNPKRGTRLENVSVLTSDMDGEHSVLIEGEDGAVVDGLWVWSTGGTHGLIVKSAHTVVRDYHCRGATADCLLVKSDYKTAGNGYAADDLFEGIDIRYLTRPGDTGGITLDGTWDSIERMTFSDVREEGLRDGFEGTGSWFHTLKDVRIQHWGGVGILGLCAAFVRSEPVAMTDVDCEGAKAEFSAKSKAAMFQAQWRGWKDVAHEIKPSLRIVWETAKTSLGRVWEKI